MLHHAYTPCTAQLPISSVVLLEKLDGQVRTKPFSIFELMNTVTRAAAQLILRDAVPTQ
jgi:hypothetical protein